MQLLDPERVPEDEVRRVFRTGPLGALFLLVLWVGILGGALLLVQQTGRRWPLPVWLFAVPMGLCGMLLWLLVYPAILGMVTACFRPSNWVMKVSGSGVFLKLRSYLNAHLEGQHPTVAYVPFEEIASAGKVRERTTVQDMDGRAVRWKTWLEIVLKGVDTSALAAAVQAESSARAPQTSFLGIRSSTRYRNVPLFVPEPGRIRVEWRRGMLRAFAGRFDSLATRTVDLDAAEGGDPRARLLALVLRGEELEAIALARSSEGLGIAEAMKRVRELRQAAAPAPLTGGGDPAVARGGAGEPSGTAGVGPRG